MARSLIYVPALAFVCALTLQGACAQSSGPAANPAPAPAAATRSAPAKPVGVPPPSSSPLAQIKVGMDDLAVRKLIGEPARQRSYITGKFFIPFYFGPDTSRSEWSYSSQGRVVFSRNRFSNNLKVIRVDYDPNVP